MSYALIVLFSLQTTIGKHKRYNGKCMHSFRYRWVKLRVGCDVLSHSFFFKGVLAGDEIDNMELFSTNIGILELSLRFFILCQRHFWEVKSSACLKKD